MNKKINLHKTALFIALLLHICGLIGILLTQYKDWFIKNTWINLLVMAALLVLTHRLKNKSFLIFLIITFIAGFAVEVLGMNTGLIFGRYTYGDVLGIKLFNVPLIIGINWFIIIYCTGMFIQVYENYMLKKLIEREIIINNRIRLISFIVDACFLAIIFDWVMEPVAVKLGYWQWETAGIPLYNYISWLIVSAALLTLFRKLNGNNRNIFAVHLFIIQLLFFLVLRTFL
jgi:bisanhydrobacterioruberin hydratase